MATVASSPARYMPLYQNNSSSLPSQPVCSTLLTVAFAPSAALSALLVLLPRGVGLPRANSLTKAVYAEQVVGTLSCQEEELSCDPLPCSTGWSGEAKVPLCS